MQVDETLSSLSPLETWTISSGFQNMWTRRKQRVSFEAQWVIWWLNDVNQSAANWWRQNRF